MLDSSQLGQHFGTKFAQNNMNEKKFEKINVNIIRTI